MDQKGVERTSGETNRVPKVRVGQEDAGAVEILFCCRIPVTRRMVETQQSAGRQIFDGFVDNVGFAKTIGTRVFVEAPNAHDVDGDGSVVAELFLFGPSIFSRQPKKNQALAPPPRTGS